MGKQLPPDLQATNIGGDHYISFLVDDKEEKIGFIEWHDCPGYEPYLSGAGVYFDTPASRAKNQRGPFWSLMSLDPLHVEPSIACKTCSNHGFIRNGKWVDA